MKCNIQRLRDNCIALLFLTLLFHSSQLHAQSGTGSVRGIVQNSNNEPLTGVSVIIRNATTKFTSGTDTDSSGVFTFSGIPLGGSYTFTVSTVGYAAQTLLGYNLKDNMPLSLVVNMTGTTVLLDQVVVVGYGVQRKSDLTGAVGSVKAEALQERPAASMNQALAGRITGVNVSVNSGRPGGRSNIRIRGNTSVSVTNNLL